MISSVVFSAVILIGIILFVFAVGTILVVGFVVSSDTVVVLVDNLMGDVLFFLPPLCVTWVHPSSLLGWSPVSALPVVLAAVATVSVTLVVVVVAAAVIAMDGVEDVFLQAGTGKMPELLHVQHNGFLPPTTTIIV